MTTAFPRLSTQERDRRWALAQRIIAEHDLAALVAYGEPEGAGVPHHAVDNYLTGERTGGTVVVPRGEPPLLLAPVHLTVGGHLEALARGDESWLEPARFVTHAGDLPAGAARGGGRLAATLRGLGLARARVGIIGLGGMSFHADGIVPAGTWRQLSEILPDVEWVPVDDDFVALTRRRSAEERELLRWCALAGERMCAAMLDAAAVGVPETAVYAAGTAECLRHGAHNSGSVLVVGATGETVEWGPPRWTYRAGPPRVLAPGDLVLAELFPVYGMLETQQQLAITVGEPHPHTARAAVVARTAYAAGVAAIGPGAVFGDVVEAMCRPVDEAGGWQLTPMIHSLNPLTMVGRCGFPDDMPELAGYGPAGGVPTLGADVVLAPGMSFALEPNCVFDRRRVNLGGTVLVTEHGVEELNALPCRLHQV